MSSTTDELFVQHCMRELAMPADFTDLPAYRRLRKKLPAKQQRALAALFDEYACACSVYAAACFAQGLRVSLDLFCRLHQTEE